MVLTPADAEKILAKVKKEPCLVQDLAQHLHKSWVTTERYVTKLAQEKGLVKVKTFREGTKGAIKVVYWNYPESAQQDEIKARAFERITLLSDKKDFSPLEIYQHVPPKYARAFYEYYDDPSLATKQHLASFFRQAQHEVFIFSGNLSFLNVQEGGKCVTDLLEELLERGITLRILCKVDVESLGNLHPLDRLLKKYPKQVDVRHRLHPLRGVLIDRTIARLKAEKARSDFKARELKQDIRLFYEITDPDWVDWLQNVFWHLYRHGIDYKARLRLIEKIMV